MPILTAESDFERIHFKSGVYPATVKEIRAQQINDRDNPGQKKTVLFWQFEIIGKTKTVLVEGMTSVFFTPKAKARLWTRAILGQDMEPPFDTDGLHGVPCRVVVVDREKDGTVYSGVDDVLSAEAAGEEV